MELQWPLILFTFFVCLASGTLLAQGVLTVLGRGGRMQLPSLITSAASLVVGGVAVFLHLQHWERVFNGFGHITSGITLELIGCIVFAITLVVYFLMMRRSEGGVAPVWCGWLSIVVALGMAAVVGFSYLMPALPAWDTPMLVMYYLCNTAFLGGLVALVIAGLKGIDDAKDAGIKLALAGGALQLVTVVIYAAIISTSANVYSDITYYFDPTLPDMSMIDIDAVTGSIFEGSQAPMFWLGVIVVGIVVPLVLLWLARKIDIGKKFVVYAGIALVCAIIGSICWRCILYVVAVSIFALF